MNTLAKTGDTLLPIVIVLIVVILAMIVIIIALRKRKEAQRREKNAYYTNAARVAQSQPQAIRPQAANDPRGARQIPNAVQQQGSPMPEERRGKHSK
ncbi:LPXTG cell wall anchor domain-containing protein [Eggerthellaceae bacterium 3-80]